MARNTRAQQKTLITTNLPTPPDANSPITAVNHREVEDDHVDSAFYLESDIIENGLTLDLAVTDGDPSTIKLGGPLTENTTISGNFNLRISEGLSCGVGALSSIGSANFRIAQNTIDRSHLNLNPNTGVNKTTPISGDLWFNGTNLNFYDGSSLFDLLSVALTNGSGTTANGTAVDLGGELTANTTIDLYDTAGMVDRDLIFTRALSPVNLFQLKGDGSWALGSGAVTNSINSVVIGSGAIANADESISIGRLAGDNIGGIGPNGNEISIGSGANQNASGIGQESVAIGVDTKSIADFSITIGKLAQVLTGNGGIAIGNGSSATGLDAPIAIGQNALSTNTRAVAISNADATGPDCISVGHLSQASGANSVALCILAIASGAQAVAIGRGATSTTTSTVSVGDNAEATFSEAVALGSNTQASANRATAIGNDVINSRADSFAWGTATTTPLFHFDNAGYWMVKNLQVFADDAAAGAGGLVADQIYKTATGELRIKL